MDRDATRIRAGKPFVFTSLRKNEGGKAIADLLADLGGFSY
jgi:urease accessory protein